MKHLIYDIIPGIFCGSVLAAVYKYSRYKRKEGKKRGRKEAFHVGACINVETNLLLFYYY